MTPGADAVRGVRDPELDQTLEELHVVSEDWVSVERTAAGGSSSSSATVVLVRFRPTLGHCAFAKMVRARPARRPPTR